MTRAFATALVAIGSIACSAAPPPPPSTPTTADEARTYDADAKGRGVPTRERWFARVPAACAQAIVIRLQAGGYRWGESFDVRARTDHWISGAVEITAPRGRWSDPFTSDHDRAYGPNQPGDDARCRPSQDAASGGASGGASAPSPSASGGASPTSAPAVPEVAVALVSTIGEDVRAPHQLASFTITHQNVPEPVFDLPPAKAGAEITLKFWAVRPIDWTGVTIEIVHGELVPNDLAKYGQIIRADIADRPDRERRSGEFVARWRAHVDDCRKRFADDDCADARPAPNAPHAPDAANPPPAPRAEKPSPKPSDGAIWIAGHWSWDGFRWSFWSPGFWRVPDDDRKGRHTPTAPGAPPVAKPETPGAPPTPGAVWTPGYWHWSASAWIWIDGAWRLPPASGASWRPFVWRVEASGVVRLDPGGWVAP